MSLTRLYSQIKHAAFWSFFLSFLTVAVMNQQPFIKDLSSNSRTAEVLLEANSLTFLKKWNIPPGFLLDSVEENFFVTAKNLLGKIYYPTQDLDTPSNPCVFEHFNIPPPGVIS